MRREYGLESTTFSLRTVTFWRGLEEDSSAGAAPSSAPRDCAAVRKESDIFDNSPSSTLSGLDGCEMRGHTTRRLERCNERWCGQRRVQRVRQDSVQFAGANVTRFTGTSKKNPQLQLHHTTTRAHASAAFEPPMSDDGQDLRPKPRARPPRVQPLAKSLPSHRSRCTTHPPAAHTHARATCVH